MTREVPMPDIPVPNAQRSQRARASIARGLALLGVMTALGCGGDAPGPVGPPTQQDPHEEQQPTPISTLTTLQVSPDSADLCLSHPKVQLTIVPRDQNGASMSHTTGTTTYSSSAPAVVQVSSSGRVTAVAPGTAAITATFTRGAITRTASMHATVHEGYGETPEIAGVYDLNALITGTDGALGLGAEGTRQTAVITIQHSGGSPAFGGTFTDFRAIDPDGEWSSGLPGTVAGSFDCVGGVVIELTFEGSQSSYWGGQGVVTSGSIAGTFGAAGGVLGGTFTAVRR